MDNLKSYIISGSYWEFSDYTLINKNTGSKSPSLWNYPHVSPKHKYIITFTNDFDEDETLIQIFENQNNTLIPLGSFGFSAWRYDDKFIWISENEFIIAARSKRDFSEWTDSNYDNNPIDKTLRKEIKKNYLKITIRNK